MRQTKYEYDAFISHAVEDKIPIANELCARLEAAGLKIWYSGKELGVGDSIEKTIEKGLNRSRYGIVIFSPTYLAKNWTIREFYTLLAKEIEEHKVILPVLYNVTLDELKNKDLVMADRFAVNSDKGMDFVVERLVREIRKSSVVVSRPRHAWLSKIRFFLCLSLLANAVFLLRSTVFSGDPLRLERAQSVRAATSPGPEAFFGEMQGLFSRMSTCSCDHDGVAGSPAQKVRFVSTGAGQAPENSHYSQQETMPVTRTGGAKKMTMAVVFQIETVGQAKPEIGGEVDDMLNTISLAGQTASQRSTDGDGMHASDHRPDCLYSAHVGE